jgi:hypothetical protein
MNTKVLSWMLMAGAFFLASQSMAQPKITWQSADASAAARGDNGSNLLYTSSGQPTVGTSTGSGRIVHSGYLWVRIVPFGAPKITTQSSVDFGSVIVSQNETRSLTVQNSGGATLQISSTTIAPAAFTIVSGGGTQTIAPGGSATVQLRFTPATNGPVAGSLTITSNASNAPTMIVTLSGTGLAQASSIVLSASALDFGAVSTSSTSMRTLIVQNTGNAALNISSQSIGGMHAADFTVTRPAVSPIAGGGSDYAEIRFAPGATGQRTATLTIQSNDPNQPTILVSLSGIGSSGAQPRISTNATLLDFGTVNVSTISTRDLVITNTGTSTLTLSGQTVSGPMFSLLTASTTTILPSQSGTARVTFTPSAIGTYNGTLEIASNDPSTPSLSIALRGICGSVSGPRLVLSRTVVDYGPVPLGTPKEEDVDISNNGTSDLVISQHSLGGADAFQFSIRQTASSPIAPSTKSTVHIIHNPSSFGSKVAKVSIASNDPGQPVTDILLISSVVSVERLDAAPRAVVLAQNYPNPFSPSTFIEYSLPAAASVELAVCSITGQRIATLDNTAREAGTYRVRYDAADLPSGAYTAVLRVITQSGETSIARILMIRAR